MQHINIDVIYHIFNFIPINDLKKLKKVSKKFYIVCNHKIKVQSKFYLSKLVLSPYIYNNVFININSNYNLLDSLIKLYNTKGTKQYEYNIIYLRCKLLNINLDLMEINLDNMKKTINNLIINLN